MSKSYIAKGTFWILSGIVFKDIIGYLNTALILRFADTSVYGTFIFLSTLIGIVTMFSQQGMHVAVTKFISEYLGKGYKDSAKSIFNDSKWLVIIAAIALTILSPIIYRLLPQEISNLINYSLFLILFIPSISINALLRINQEGFMGLKLPFLNSITGYFLNPIFRILCIFSILVFIPTITGLIYIKIIPLAITYLISEILISRRELVFTLPSFEHTKLLYKFSLPVIGGSLLSLGIYRLDRIFLGYMTDPKSVGIYNVCSKIAFIVVAPYWACAKAWGPLMSEYWSKGQYDKLKSYYQKIAYLYMFILGSLFSLIVVNNELILSIFGSEFTTQESKLVLFFIGVGLLFQTIPGQNGKFYQMSGKTYLSTINAFLATILNIILNLILIRKYGIIGAALATGISIAFANLIGLGYFKFVFQNKVHPFCVKYFVNLAYMIVVVTISYLMQNKNIYLSNIILITFIFVFGFVVLFEEIKEFIKESKRFIKRENATR